jgi:hypothetical protein
MNPIAGLEVRSRSYVFRYRIRQLADQLRSDSIIFGT